ncbi:ATP-binding protein [Sphingomonas sp. HITSZ_GF]|uniref:sensor histidine kinase n=1 Tax=Sphingomonas sp. HITSZ_GF TaxID=3037247 RepID=UPI00240E442F|nr:ATP-binding protein [Sphingomonas sp. HITSZ_GF]MDG2534327.1 ATP-binding protein [Sphingomonas sp. HITSZ_GF]
MAIAMREGGEAEDQLAYRWATWLLVLSTALPVIPLIGWVLQIPVVRGMGNPSYAISPFATAIFLLIAIGALFAHRYRYVPARAFVGVAMVPLLLLAVQFATGHDFHLGRLLFGRQVEALHVFNHGVPGTGAVSVMLLDCVAILLMTIARPLPRTWAVILASTSIGLSVLTVTMMLITPPAAFAPTFIGRSIISSLPNFLMAGAILLHLFNDRPEGDLGFEYRLLRRLSPAIIVLPVFPSLLALATVGGELLNLNEAQFMVVACNILIVSLLLTIGLRSARQQNEVVRLREDQLRAILAGVPDAVIVVDRTGLVTDFSLAAAHLWAVPLDAQGCNMATYLGEREKAKLARLLDAAEPEFMLTGEGVRTDGSRFPLELRGAAFQGIDGATCFTLFARDLSEKLAAEQHVARLGEQLAHVSRHNAMGELATDLAHELNQPLTAASNYLSTVGYMLDQRGDDSDAPELVGHARNQVARAGEIIRRMREFAQHREVEKRAEPLVPMIEDAMQLVLAGTGGHDVEIELAVEPRDVRVFVDRIQFQQVAVNLLRNAVEAIRHSERGRGKILIAASQVEPEWVELQFIDDGPGVPEPILDQLFERFTSTKAGVGMGIGLSISRRIIEAHGGTMSVVNGTVAGATFRFTLPAVTKSVFD